MLVYRADANTFEEVPDKANNVLHYCIFFYSKDGSEDISSYLNDDGGVVFTSKKEFEKYLSSAQFKDMLSDYIAVIRELYAFHLD